MHRASDAQAPAKASGVAEAEAETKRRADAALKKMLTTPPAPCTAKKPSPRSAKRKDLVVAILIGQEYLPIVSPLRGLPRNHRSRCASKRSRYSKNAYEILAIKKRDSADAHRKKRRGYKHPFRPPVGTAGFIDASRSVTSAI